MKSLILNALKEQGYYKPNYIYDLSQYNKNDRKQIINAVKKYFKKYLFKR